MSRFSYVSVFSSYVSHPLIWCLFGRISSPNWLRYCYSWRTTWLGELGFWGIFNISINCQPPTDGRQQVQRAVVDTVPGRLQVAADVALAALAGERPNRLSHANDGDLQYIEQYQMYAWTFTSTQHAPFRNPDVFVPIAARLSNIMQDRVRFRFLFHKNPISQYGKLSSSDSENMSVLHLRSICSPAQLRAFFDTVTRSPPSVMLKASTVSSAFNGE